MIDLAFIIGIVAWVICIYLLMKIHDLEDEVDNLKVEIKRFGEKDD